MILGLSFDKELWIPFVASNCLKFLAVPVSSSQSFYDGWDHNIIIFVFLRYYVLLELSITLNLNKICSLLFQLTINLMLVSFNEQSIPSLERPYLCCKPTLSVRQLRKVFVFYLILWFSFDCTSPKASITTTGTGSQLLVQTVCCCPNCISRWWSCIIFGEWIGFQNQPCNLLEWNTVQVSCN